MPNRCQDSRHTIGSEMTERNWFLGCLKGTGTRVYLADFKWECDWFWSGGCKGSKDFKAHFDGAFLKVPDIRGHCLNSKNACFITPWQKTPEYYEPEKVKVLTNGAAVREDLDFFLDSAQYGSVEWWRIKDLFKQFYTLRDAAEVFQYGGHCSTRGRTKEELNKEMADSINKHIETVIIPLIRRALDKD